MNEIIFLVEEAEIQNEPVLFKNPPIHAGDSTQFYC
jgi:hypothetical protein